MTYPLRVAGVSAHGYSAVASRKLDLFQQSPGVLVGEWTAANFAGGVDFVPFLGIDATTGVEHWPDAETTAFCVRLS